MSGKNLSLKKSKKKDSSKGNPARRKNKALSTRLTGLTLLVSDIGKSVNFYSKVPDAILLVNTPEFAMMKIGNENRLGLLKSSNKKTGFHLEFVTNDLDQLYSRMSATKGTTDASPPRRKSWGERSFTMKDPDGYQLEFEDGGTGQEID